MNLENLSNDELLSGLDKLVGQGRVILARLLAYLAEVEERRLDLESACSSLWDFCVRRLGMGDDEACRRVAAARLVRRFPAALGMIARGEIHLTALLLLREHLTEGNHAELLRAASGRTKGEVQHVIARLFPRPDVPSRIQPLRVGPAGSPQATESLLGDSAASRLVPPPPSRVEPLSSETYKVQFTASAELKAKIERAANLMRHANPRGDLAVVMDRAVDLLLAALEKQRLARTVRSSRKAASRPSAVEATPEGKVDASDSTAAAPTDVVSSSTSRPGYVSRPVRREVFERDGLQCTYIDDCGRRCESRAFLELDHGHPRALGGADDAFNLSVKCRAHNLLAAERAFGREHVEKKKNEKKSVSLQRGCYEASRTCGSREASETALRALCAMGFRGREVRRALALLEERRAGSHPPPIEALLRDALAVLA